MTSIERTAYPRFTRAPSVKELRELFTPTPTDVAFVATRARGPAQKFALMSHLRAVMKYPPDLVPDIAPATLYRYYAAIREHLDITSQGKALRHTAARAMHTAAQVMESPADLINAAIQTLLLQRCELPAFSTLDRMAGRIRRLVNHSIYQTVFARLTAAEQETWSRLLEPEGSTPLTAFDRVKDAPRSATLTHLDEWLSRL